MLADRYGCILFDLDGVLYRGRKRSPAPPPWPSSGDAASASVFLTNNSSRTPRQVADKLRAIGIEADPDEVVTSALATAELLAAGGGRAFVIGQDGVREALTDAGIRILEGEPEEADLVVVGFDGGAVRVAQARVAAGPARGASGRDERGRSYPAADGLWPGAGALLSVITTTTGAEPEIVGKPFHRCSRPVAGGGRRPAARRRGPARHGHRGAARLGWDTMLVLTGVSSREDVERTGIRPTVIAEDVSALLEDPGERAAAALSWVVAPKGAPVTEHPGSRTR